MLTAPSMDNIPHGPFDYSLFGLRVRSELRLPELMLLNDHFRAHDEPDVIIRLGEDRTITSAVPRLQLVDGAVCLAIQGVALYSVAEGARITVHPEPGVPDINLRLYLLGSAMGLVLHQRGLLPLHANAVEIGGRAFAFMGPSGAGKSTLAAWFHDHGYRIIADDVCALRFDPTGPPFVTPGLRRLRLWKEALEGTGRKASQYQRSYAGDESWDKFDVPLAHKTAVLSEVELAGVYLLGKTDSFAIRHLERLEATEALLTHTYRRQYLTVAGNVQGHWESCVRLAKHTPVFHLCRPWGLSHLTDEIARLVAHATQVGDDGRQKPRELK